MPTYMDVHEGMHVTLQQLMEAHKKDVEAQKGTGVEYVRYWLDSKAGKVFCLAKGPNKEAVEAGALPGGRPGNVDGAGRAGPSGAGGPRRAAVRPPGRGAPAGR